MRRMERTEIRAIAHVVMATFATRGISKRSIVSLIHSYTRLLRMLLSVIKSDPSIFPSFFFRYSTGLRARKAMTSAVLYIPFRDER